MPLPELVTLKQVISQERRALINGAVEEILRWATFKAKIVDCLREKELTEEDRLLLQEILKENEINKKIIEAGLSFVEEAYRFLQKFLMEDESYQGKETNLPPKIISKKV